MRNAKLRIKRMGVMNITPNSFSDGGEVTNLDDYLKKISTFGKVDAIDIGAESTAPNNSAISWTEEWGRWQWLLPQLVRHKSHLSLDSYHPETVFELVRFWKDNKMLSDLYWNDISGKFDGAVRDYLKEGGRFHYIYCHNRAPKRELSGNHMQFVSKDEGRIEEELLDFFAPFKHEKVVFDPCLGFSKTYDENWYILDHFAKFQTLIKHDRWLLGFSRKSFIKKKFGTENRDELDKIHQDVLKNVVQKTTGELWIRSHRPELISLNS